jgi:F0F1-type ATP synthase membrane subunit b/b'
MAIHRAVGVVPLAILSASVLLASCSGTSNSSLPAHVVPPPAASSTPPVRSSAVLWANGVCSASTGLETAIRQLGGTIQIARGGSGATLEQIRAQVSSGVDAVHQSADQLRTALAAVPAQADDRLTAAQQTLQATADSARQQVQTVTETANDLTDNASRQEMFTDLTMLARALTTAAADVQTYLSSLRATAASREGVVHNTFAAAPACATAAQTQRFSPQVGII